MTTTEKKVGKIVTLLTGGAILLTAVYIMIRRKGLVDDLDFGAGAYYYADIPGFQQMEEAVSYTTDVPVWVHIILFLLWGALMYFLWTRIDRPHRK